MKKLNFAGDGNRSAGNINKGFIIASVLCLVLVAAAVYFTVKSFNDAAADNRSQVFSGASESSSADRQRPATVQSSRPSSSAQSSAPMSSEAVSRVPEKEEISEADRPQSEAETSARPAPAVSFAAPLVGEVSAEFSEDRLVFSETLRDWRVHNGTDFSAPVGTSVEAVADGTVEDVYYDELLGHTVSIAHDDGHVSVYCGLNDVTFVEEGERVEQGYVIGTIGDEMPLESAQEPHLHLEIIKDGARVDPLSVIGQ